MTRKWIALRILIGQTTFALHQPRYGIGLLRTTGRWISGTEGVEWGLALRSVPADDLDEELETLLKPLRTKSRDGMALIKEVTSRGMSMPLEDGVALESFAFSKFLITSPHPAEGIKAFLEKRQPEF